MPSACVTRPAHSPRARSHSSRSHSPTPWNSMRSTRSGCSRMSSAMRVPPSRRYTDMRSRVATVNATVRRVAVEQVHVARPVGERARCLNPVADVLHAFRRVARDHAARCLVIEAEGGDAIVLAVKDPGLAVRRRGRQAAEPASQREPVLVHESRERRAVKPSSIARRRSA